MGLEVDDEPDDVPDETAERQDLDGEEAVAAITW
jgi:hypothetical protein